MIKEAIREAEASVAIILHPDDVEKKLSDTRVLLMANENWGYLFAFPMTKPRKNNRVKLDTAEGALRDELPEEAAHRAYIEAVGWPNRTAPKDLRCHEVIGPSGSGKETTVYRYDNFRFEFLGAAPHQPGPWRDGAYRIWATRAEITDRKNESWLSWSAIGIASKVLC